MKRIISVILIVAAVLSFTGCAKSPEKKFEDEANEWFALFDESYDDAEYNYKKTGSVAYRKPKLDMVEANQRVNDIYDNKETEFKSLAASSDDKLFITYKMYNPSDTVFGAEITAKTVLNGTETQTVDIVNFDRDAASGSEFSELLKRMTIIEAKERGTVDDDCKLLYTNEGIDVINSDGRITVPYVYVRPYLPESVKQNVKEDDSIRVIDVTKKMVAITYDDGPHGVYTKQLLDIFEEYNSVATFFEVGQNLQYAPDQLLRMDEMGCEIASHTWSHANLQTSSSEKIKQQLKDANDEFESILGYVPTLLRPPYGAVGSSLKEISDQYLIGWSVDTMDWSSRDKDAVIKTVKNEKDLDGDVILMHSLYKSTVDASKELIPWLIENDYQLVTVSEMIKYRYQDEWEKGKYYTYNYYDNEPKTDK